LVALDFFLGKFFRVGRLFAWSNFFQKWKVGFLASKNLGGEIFSEGSLYFEGGSFSGDLISTWKIFHTADPSPHLARKVALVIEGTTIQVLPVRKSSPKPNNLNL
jgi:hypothetical protein